MTEYTKDEVVGGWILIIVIAVVGYFGWQWLANDDNGAATHRKYLEDRFMLIGLCVEVNDMITNRIAEVSARGLTSGNETYFILTNAREESSRLRNEYHIELNYYASDLSELGVSASSWYTEGQRGGGHAFQAFLTTGNRSAFFTVIEQCNLIRM